LKLERIGDAIKDFTAAFALDPTLATSLYGSGLAKLKNGDREGAQADMIAAKDIETNVAEELARDGIK